MHHDMHCYCENGTFNCEQAHIICEGEPVDDKPNKKPTKKPIGSPRDLYCFKDIFQCPDGTSVGRDPKNNCEFKPCPQKEKPKEEPMMCPYDLHECPDGTMVDRDSENNCEFKPCPPAKDNNTKPTEDVTYCPTDTKKCADGGYLKRDQKNN